MSSAAADATPPFVDVVVVGAGVAGLAAALRLEDAVRSGAIRSYWIVDPSAEPGGVIRTTRRDGYLVEAGPDMFFAEKPEVIEMAGRLGLAGELIHTNPHVRRSFIAAKGRLRPLPDGFFLTAPSRLFPFLSSDIIGPVAKLRMALEPFIPSKKTAEDESVADFVRRRFGASALRRIAQPMIGGIYTGDPERLSARWAMPKFVEWERRCGSVTRGLCTKGSDPAAGSGTAGPRYQLFQSFRKGMGSLVQAMTAPIHADRMRMNTSVTHLEQIEGGWSVSLRSEGEGSGKECLVRCASVILALPAAPAARLLRTAAPDLSGLLGQVRSESCAVVLVGWDRSRVRHPLNGLGFVVPAEEKLPFIAGSFSSVKFEGRAPQGKALFRFFVGGAFGRRWLELPENELWNAIRPGATRLLGLEGEPDFTQVVYYREAMPQYETGHDAWLEKVGRESARRDGLEICGAMLRGVGISDVIRSGGEAAAAILEKQKDRAGARNGSSDKP